MSFNSDKFECLRYWADPAQAPPFQFLGPDGQPIQVKSDLSDLGVQLSSKIRLVGWGMRTFWDRGRKVMLTLTCMGHHRAAIQVNEVIWVYSVLLEK